MLGPPHWDTEITAAAAIRSGAASELNPMMRKTKLQLTGHIFADVVFELGFCIAQPDPNILLRKRSVR
jgi:hypothetical protein